MSPSVCAFLLCCVFCVLPSLNWAVQNEPLKPVAMIYGFFTKDFRDFTDFTKDYFNGDFRISGKVYDISVSGGPLARNYNHHCAYIRAAGECPWTNSS